MIRTLAIALALLVALSVAPAQDLEELELDHSVASEFVTPHTKWAQPYALGRIRALFFVNGRGTAPREVVELTQRFDLDAQMVFWARIVDTNIDGWHGAENGVRRILRLLNEPWDVFVFQNTALKNLPAEAQYLLVKQVTEGAGLVLSGVTDERIFKEKNRIANPPITVAGEPVGPAYTILRGRGLLLPGQPNIEYAVGWEMLYDIWQLRLGKALLWAAGRAPEVDLRVSPPQAPLPRAQLPAVGATVHWQAPAAARDLRLEMTLRRGDGWRSALPQVEARAAVGEAQVQVPLVRAGDYQLDIIARSARGIEACDSVPITVTSERRISAVGLEQDWGEVGEQLSGAVMLEGSPLPGESLRVSLYDARGRELRRQELAAGATGFDFPITDWLPMLVRVQAELWQNDQPVSAAYQFARVTKRHRGRFNFLIWDCPSGTLAPYAEQALARTGVTLQLRGGDPPLYVAANDIAWVPYTTRIVTSWDEAGVMKPGCWNDEDHIRAYVQEIVSKHEGARRHGVFVYSLGDEVAVRGSCLSPHCLAAYQRYLQEQYGSIEALNASWGTDYADFTQVRLSNEKDNNEAEAFRAGNFPRWYDRQAFQSYNFCRLCQRFGEAFRALDPQSLCGFEGAGRFQDGDDLDGFVRYNTFWSPYPGSADEVLRSIAPRDFPRANWMGYTKDADSLLAKYWRMVTRGCDSVWWWRWDCIGRFHGWIAPTLDPYPAVKEILADTRVLRAGLGDLLLHSEMLDDGIGMLYSQPSAYAAKIPSATTFGSFEGDHVAWHNNLRDLGLQFRYVTDRQLRLGEADLGRFKVFILPFTQALGPEEAEALRRYVSDGGTLIADVRPGICDGHCKQLPAGALDEVFGIRRTGVAEAVNSDGSLRLTADGTTVELAAKLQVDPGVEAVAASVGGAAGQTPLLLVHQFGRGRAVLLNFTMSSYPLLSAEGTDEAAATLLGALLAQAGVRPTLSLQDAQGRRVRNVEVIRWQNGRYQIISVFRQQGQTEPARLVLPEEARLHDLKARRDLGAGRSFDITITPYRALMLMVTERPPAPLRVTTDRKRVARGEQLTATVAVPEAAGLHGIKLTVTAPDGSSADWLEQVLLADRAGTQVTLPIAYNDPAGEWTITATDVLPTAPATTKFEVR